MPQANSNIFAFSKTCSLLQKFYLFSVVSFQLIENFQAYTLYSGDIVKLFSVRWHSFPQVKTFLKKNYDLILNVWVFCLQECPLKPEEGTRSFGTGVRDSSKLPLRCWELNSHLLEEQPVSLTAESSLNSSTHFF